MYKLHVHVVCIQVPQTHRDTDDLGDVIGMFLLDV